MNIEVRGLNFSYGTHAVLNNVSFTTNDGKLLFILGPNGVGKSTLFRCILGLLKGYEGEILVGGADARHIPARELAHMIAYIPQMHHATFNYTVLDMVLMGTAHQFNSISAPKQKEMAQAWSTIEMMGITELAEKSFLKLSGGEQQLVLIARALAQQARILLMDEPTSNLDFGNQLRVLKRIRQLAKSGYTILMSSHNPQNAMLFADQIIALYDGQIIVSGSPLDVMNEALLKKLYDVDAQLIDTHAGRIISPLVEGVTP